MRFILLTAIGALVFAAIPATAQPEVAAIQVERIRASVAPTAPAGNRVLTIVRVDPRRYAFRFLGEGFEGPRRPATAWVNDFDLAGAINAGMFMPDGRSVGYLVADGQVRSDRRPRRFDGVFAFDPRRTAVAPVEVGGAGCARNLAALRTRYRSVLQAYRMMVDCRGNAVAWPHRRRYSAAAIGTDQDGRVVLVHSRTPYRPRILNRMLAAEELGIRGLVYLEGGPEASLVIEAEGVRVREIGSWEDGFNEDDDNRAFWDLPNVIGFSRR